MTCYSGQNEIEYYPSGTIKSYVTLISDEFQIGEQYVKVAESTKITFHPNGNIESFILADDAKLKSGSISKLFRQNEKIELCENGNLNLNSANSEVFENGNSKTFLDVARNFLGL